MPANKIVIRLSEKLQYYSAVLNIEAKFYGLKYYLNKWYYTCSFLICLGLTFITFVVLLSSCFDLKSILYSKPKHAPNFHGSHHRKYLFDTKCRFSNHSTHFFLSLNIFNIYKSGSVQEETRLSILWFRQARQWFRYEQRDERPIDHVEWRRRRRHWVERVVEKPQVRPVVATIVTDFAWRSELEETVFFFFFFSQKERPRRVNMRTDRQSFQNSFENSIWATSFCFVLCYFVLRFFFCCCYSFLYLDSNTFCHYLVKFVCLFVLFFNFEEKLNSIITKRICDIIFCFTIVYL